MKLSQALADQVPDQSRSRGAAYFLNGDVRSVEAHDNIIHAVVKGGEWYDVWLEPVGATLLASCTCPYFFDRIRDLQTHLGGHPRRGGAIAAPHAARRLTAFRRPRADRRDAELEDLGLDDETLVDEEDDGWHSRRPAPEPRPKSVSAAPPRWRQLLDAIGGIPSPTPARPRIVPGQLLYIIDVAASLAGAVLVIELMTRDRKANGEWGKPKPARLTPADIQSLPDGTERHTLERLVGARPHFNYGAWTDYGYELSRFRLHGVLAADVVPLSVRNRTLPGARDRRHRPAQSAPAPPARMGRRCAVEVRRQHPPRRRRKGLCHRRIAGAGR